MLAQIAALAAVGALGASSGVVTASRRDDAPPTRKTVAASGKPPINGKRECERRLRQMDRAARKAKRVAGA